jgi:formylglycine-generating enzyme required for sulfatase activity
LNCFGLYATWTSTADADEKLPINCVNWFQAYAFCIWDGGFLPSEAEWSYAAAGGSEQRKYPWGSTDPGANADTAIYNCYYATAAGHNVCEGIQNIAPVGHASGTGAWGQRDLGGNVYEWTLDWNAPYAASCNDCAVVVGDGQRVDRGGAYDDTSADLLLSTARHARYPKSLLTKVGFRCARAP